MDAVKVRVSARILEFMSGGGVWQALQFGTDVSREDEATVSLHHKVMKAPGRADESVTVELTPDEANSLYGYADLVYQGARDNVGHDPEWSLPDLRSSSALMAKLEKLFGPEVSR